MQVNPLLSTLPQMPQTVQQNQQPAVSAQQAPVPAQTGNAVSAIGQSEAGSKQSDATQKQPVDEKELSSAVDQLNDTAKLFNTQLQFSVDPDTGRRVVKVTDSQTNQVIRQIPAEDVLRLSKAIGDFKGLLVKDTA
jgi:flagellar protein FlaG